MEQYTKNNTIDTAEQCLFQRQQLLVYQILSTLGR